MSGFKFINRKAGRNILLAMAIALPAAGCETIYDDVDDNYVPATHYERFPIGVAKTPVNIGIGSEGGHLGPRQQSEVTRFAQAAAGSSSKVFIRRPSAGGRSTAVAGEIEYVLEANGVSRRRIVHTTYQASATAPVLVSFLSKGAAYVECGDWSKDVSTSYKNEPYPNFGCAQQHNIAAMLANPEDYDTPRNMTPPDQMRRTVAIDKYRKGETTGAAADQQQQIAISSVAQ
ncbi:CpaD family pilus assembly protein [soil metagenome]